MELERQSWTRWSARAADPKFGPGRVFFSAEPQLKVPDLCPARGKPSQRIIYWQPGFVRCLKRCWPGSMLGPPDFVRCRSKLGLGFWINVCISSMTFDQMVISANLGVSTLPGRIPQVWRRSRSVAMAQPQTFNGRLHRITLLCCGTVSVTGNVAAVNY